MSTVDSRIVTMKFDNSQFMAGIRSTLSALTSLKNGMNLQTAARSSWNALNTVSQGLSKLGILNPFKSLTDRFNGFSERVSFFSRLNPFSKATAGATELNRSAQAATTQGMGSLQQSTNGVSAGFIAMTTVAVTALTNITNAAFRTGTDMAKALTVDPVKTGLNEYETNLNSIQTILANTKVSGATLDDVNHALDELNHYSDTTIYNFAEMAKNIGTFTAAGVGLDESVQSIKGIANLAALSGSNSQQAATAMYQLSQEIAAGRVSLMGWNSVVNAGMGGSTFQRALAQTAVAMGEIDESAVKLEGEMKNVTINGQSFRDSIMAKPGEVSWLTKDVLTGTLAQFTNDMSKAQIMAQGFNESQAESIMATARTAQAAAQDVKTLSGVFDVAKETAASGWSRTWMLIFGDFKEAKTLFTNFSSAFSGMIASAAEKRNALLEGWQELGGRDVLIEAITNALKALMAILKPIKDAFRDIFPAQTAEGLYELTKRFRDFTEGLKPSKETVEDLRRTFRGVFAVLSIIGQVIGGVASMFGRLFGAIGEGSGGFLDFTGGIGDFLVALDKAIEKGGFLTAFFGGLGNILAVPLNILKKLASAFAGLFDGLGGDGGGVGEAVAGIEKDLEPLERVADKVKAIFSGIGNFLSNLGAGIVDALATIGAAIVDAFSSTTFDQVLDTINTGLFAALTAMFAKFTKGGIGMDLTGGLFDGVTETLGAVTGTLKSMQAQIKADIIIKIAIALALLTASIFVLSTIDGDDLAKSLGGMSAGFAGMGGALVYLSKAISFLGMAKLPIITAALVALSVSILIMATALKIMSTIDGGDMVKSLLGLAGALFILTKATQAMSKNSGPMLRSAITIGILAVSLNILAVALKIMATMSWEEMAKGLVGLAVSLGVLVAALRLMPKDMELQAAGLIALGIAINLIAIALKILATMSMEDLAKSLLGLATALAVIAAAISVMPKTMMLQAASLVVVAGALVVLAGALKIFASMSWEGMAKGLIMLGGALLIIGFGLKQFGLTALLGAAALVVTAAGLNLLIPLLVMMGAMSWESIIKGLVGLAGTFVILGVAGYMLAPVTPIIFALSIAILAIGAGFLLAGAGALMLASAFGIFVGALVVGGAAVGRFVGNIIRQIPNALRAFARGIVGMVQVIARSGPQMVRAFSAILSSILKAVIRNVPLMGRAFMTMLSTALRVIVTMAPRIFNAGLQLIVGFLRAISNNIGKIVNIAADIIVKFVNGIARNIGRIIQSGVNLIIKFVNGVSAAIDRNSARMGEAGARLAVAIVRGMANGIAAGAGVIKDAAIGAAKSALDGAMGFLGINSPSKEFHKIGMWTSLGMAEGISTYSKSVNRSAEDLGKGALTTMKKTMTGVAAGVPRMVDTQPTIRPVLDLSQVQKESVKMGAMLATDKMTASASFESALKISNDTNAAAEASADVPREQVVKEIKFEQHNHSPKALDPVEVYRGSRNLLSLAKEELSREGYTD